MRSWILRDLCDDNLLDAVERNHYENLFYFPSRHPQMQVITQDDLIIIDSEMPSSALNYVCTTKNLAENYEKKLEKAEDFFKNKESACSWVIGPSSASDGVLKALHQLGHNKTEHLVTLLLNLNFFSRKLKYIPGFRVQHALTKATLCDVAKVYGSFVNTPDILERYFLKISSLAFHQLDPMRYFIGYLKQQPVVVGELFLGAGLAGMRVVVDKNLEDQEKDLSFDVITKMILVAQQQGYHFAVTTSVLDKASIYEELGFKKYCEFYKVT
jgi:hypothetical protein